MQAYDDDGALLDAEYTVVQNSGYLELILDSRGGSWETGRTARNPDYLWALAVLLARLRDRHGVIEDALVDSLVTQRSGLSEAERRLIDGPIRLDDVDDLTALRRRLMAAQRPIGQSPK
jgi:hypothetical protein